MPEVKKDDFPDDPKTWPKSPLVTLDPAHKDDRGAIQPLVERFMRSACLITSKKDAVRANHYHKTDWHYCYIVSGRLEYYERPVGSKEKPKPLLVKGGQMIFTPPWAEHAMRFLEDSVWVTLSRNPRDQESYEKDVVRVQVIDP